MTTKKPKIIAWKSPKLNYRIVASNGKTLLSSLQGFERFKDMVKNITAVSELFIADVSIGKKLTIHMVKTRYSKTVISEVEIHV